MKQLFLLHCQPTESISIHIIPFMVVLCTSHLNLIKTGWNKDHYLNYDAYQATLGVEFKAVCCVVIRDPDEADKGLHEVIIMWTQSQFKHSDTFSAHTRFFDQLFTKLFAKHGSVTRYRRKKGTSPAVLHEIIVSRIRTEKTLVKLLIWLSGNVFSIHPKVTLE